MTRGALRSYRMPVSAPVRRRFSARANFGLQRCDSSGGGWEVQETILIAAGGGRASKTDARVRKAIRMSRVEGDFLLSKHVDVIGAGPGPGDTALVTLRKGGVIQHQVGQDSQVQTWTLGGPASRRVEGRATYVRSKAGEVHFAAVVQERKRHHLWVWDQTHTSVSEGTKVALNLSEKTVVFSVDRAGKSPGYFLIASLGGRIGKLEPGSSVSWVDASPIPDGAKALDVELSYLDDSPCLCYVYELAGERHASFCRIAASGKSLAAEVVVAGIGVGSAPGVSAFYGDAIAVVDEEGRLGVIKAGQDGASSTEVSHVCVLGGMAGHECVFLTPTQVAVVGLSRAKGKPESVVVTIVDTEYKLLLHQYSTGEDCAISKAESLIGASLLNEETLLVATNRQQFCFKLSVAEMSFSTVLGMSKRREKEANEFVDFRSGSEAERPSVRTIAAGDFQRLPGTTSRQQYDVYESSSESNRGKGGCLNGSALTKEVASLTDHFKSSDLSSSKSFLKRLKDLVAQSSSATLLLSEGFISSLWDECVRLGCWEGVELLLSQNLVNDGAHACQILGRLLRVSQYKHFGAVLKTSATLSETDLLHIIKDILGCDMADQGVQSCLISLVSRGKGFSPETITGAVRGLGMEEVIKLAEALNSNLKAEMMKDGKKNEKIVGGIVTFVSSIIDAHLTNLLLAEESHGVFEELFNLVRIQVQYEKSVTKLTELIKHLGSVVPMQEQAQPHTNDLTVEILNLGV